MPNRKKILLSDLSLLIVAAMWGGGFSFTKNILQYVTPLYYLSARFLLAAAILGIIFYPKVKRANRLDIKNSMTVGIFLMMAFSTQTIGLQFTTPGKQAFITSAYVVMIPFLSFMVSKYLPSKKEIAGAVLCMIGLSLLSITREMSINIGDVLTLVSAFFFAGHIVSIGVYANRINTMVMNVYQFLLAGIGCGILAYLIEPVPTTLALPAVYSLAYLVVFSTIGAFMIQVTAQKYTYPTHAGIILSLEAVFGALFAYIFWSETFTTQMILGCTIIFIAILVTEVKFSKEKEVIPAQTGL